MRREKEIIMIQETVAEVEKTGFKSSNMNNLYCKKAIRMYSYLSIKERKQTD